MRLFFIILLTLFTATIAVAQSDCALEHCGTVPLLGVNHVIIDDETVVQRSDVFLRYNANGPLWLRLRPVPPSFTLPPVVLQLTDQASMGVVGVYDLVAWAWGPEAEHQGAVAVDWASDGFVLEFDLQHLVRASSGTQAALGAYLMPSGCRVVPRPQGAADGLRFQVLSTSETETQTISINGGPVNLVPPAPLGAEQLLDLEGSAPGAWVEVCTGVDPPVGVGNLNPGLPVWVLFRFTVGDDQIVTRPWSLVSAPD
jgi:hypothetical protein